MRAIRTVLYALGFGLIVAITFFAAMPAHATGRIESVPGDADTITSGSNASASASAQGGAASVSGVQTSGGGGGSVADYSRSSLYVFPPPAAAAPLPSTVCPKGDSLAWSIGWGFFSYAVSSTRTELDCLERWVALMHATAPKPVQQPLLVIPPEVKPAPAPEVKPVEPAKPAAAPKKVSAIKPQPKAIPLMPMCGDGQAMACTPVKPRT